MAPIVSTNNSRFRYSL